MNRYTEDHQRIIAADGEYKVNTWYHMPVPDGIDTTNAIENRFTIVFAPVDAIKTPYTHWLARPPLPEIPKVNTLEEKDEEVFQVWCKYTYPNFGGVTDNFGGAFVACWAAALAYARSTQKEQP